MLVRELPPKSADEKLVLKNADSSHAQILTVNLEDYFQAGAFHRFISPRNWYRFESRLEKNTEETLELLAQHDAKATFFVLGWIAEKYPELIRSIAKAGHEIASRGHLHQPLLKLSAEARREDLRRSREILEDTVGKPVVGFRLSDGWLHKKDLGFLDELLEAGYLYDSSLMPRRRDFSQQPWRRHIHEQTCSNGTILEIPPSTMPFAGGWWPIAGGNYLRQLPESLMNSAIEKWQQTESSPFVMYFQVWELDELQPRLSVTGRLTKIRHYRNLGKYRTLLPQYLASANFTSIQDHAKLNGSPLSSLSKQVHNLAERPVRARLLNEVAVTTPDEDSTAGNSGIRRTQRPAATLVIPCYNEESTLPYLHRTMQSLRHELSRQWDLKILFVDDCSKDNTYEVLQSLFGDDTDIGILRHETNKGVSAAILTGINAAQTEIIASIDADCSYDPHELTHMLPRLTRDVAMVTASPYHRDGKVNNVPSWRLVLSHTLSCMYRILLGQKLSTWTSCFRVYRKQQIVDLPLVENGFLGTAELAAQLSLHGRKIVEHPATLEVRLFGFSKMKTVRTILAHLRLLSKVVARKLSGSHGALK
jgi:polysaccharide deacetylase family protein (PEP-CTERM system associated)